MGTFELLRTTTGGEFTYKVSEELSLRGSYRFNSVDGFEACNMYGEKTNGSYASVSIDSNGFVSISGVLASEVADFSTIVNDVYTKVLALAPAKKA